MSVCPSPSALLSASPSSSSQLDLRVGPTLARSKVKGRVSVLIGPIFGESAFLFTPPTNFSFRAQLAVFPFMGKASCFLCAFY